MADDADRSDHKITDLVDDSLSKIRRHMASRELAPIGACHWCNEYVKGDRLFCCLECSDVWERNNRYARR